MPPRLRYFLYTSPLLLSLLFPLSFAHAWDPTSVTATPGACSSGAINLSWAAPYSKEGGAVNVGQYADQVDTSFSSGQSQTISTTIHVPNPLPPGKYTVTTGVYDPNWDNPNLWSSGTIQTIMVAAGSGVTSVAATGTFNQSSFSGGYTGPVHITFWLIPDYGNSDFYSYDIQDSGTSVYTGLPSGCPTKGSPDNGSPVTCSYTFKGLSANSSHRYSIATVYAHEATSDYIAASPASATAPNTCALPNLRAGNPDVSGPATASESESFSASAYNIGAAPASDFPNIFQIANSDGSVTVARIDAGTDTSSLAAGGSFALNSSYTFATAGAYAVRACANMDTSGATVISESDTNDNCSDWQPLTISQSGGSCPNGATDYPTCQNCPPPEVYNASTKACDNPSSPPAPIVNFSASPRIITQGDSSTLTWTSTDATSCTGTGFSTGSDQASNNDTGVSTGALNTLGSHSYKITCSGAGGTATGNATVIVNPASAPGVTITADPTHVLAGGSSNISWTINDVQNCSITKQIDAGPVAAWQPSITSSGSAADSNLYGQKIMYTVSCSGGASDSVTVTVQPVIQEF